MRWLHIGYLARVIFILFILSFGAYAQQSDREKILLASSLEAMGFEEVTISGCEMSYLLFTDPTSRNNQQFAIWRYFDLESLQDFRASEVYAASAPSGTNYLLDFQFDEIHQDRYFPIYRFDSFVRDSFPDSNWPYHGGALHDEYAARIEFEINQQISELSRLNRRISFSKFGPLTYVEANMTSIASRDRDSLNRLKESIMNYAVANSCDVDD